MATLLSYKIYPLNQDINKTWFVEYKLDTGRPQKKYGNLSRCFTLQEKMDEANKIIEGLKLMYGDVEENNNTDVIAKELQKNFEIRSVYLRKKSVSTYQSKVKIFIAWYRLNYKSKEVQKIGLGHAFVKYLRDLGKSATTINSYRMTVNEFWPKGIFNPMRETFKLKESRTSYLYFDEIKQQELSYEIPKRHAQLWLAVQIQFYLLLRPDELRTVRIGQFNFQEQRLQIYGVDAKNTTTMFVAIPDELLPFIQHFKSYPSHYFVFGHKGSPGLIAHNKKYFSDKHQAILKELGYDTNRYKFYSWKHTGAVMYYLKTGDIKSLQLQGRWHSMDMVNEYLKNLGVMDIDRVKTDFPKIGGSGAAVIKIAN